MSPANTSVRVAGPRERLIKRDETLEIAWIQAVLTWWSLTGTSKMEEGKLKNMVRIGLADFSFRSCCPETFAQSISKNKMINSLPDTILSPGSNAGVWMFSFLIHRSIDRDLSQ